VAVAVAVAVLTPAHAATPSSLVRPLAGAEVDWSAGTVTASAGAAADMRMPSPEAARPGAERRARAAAMEKLRAALRALPVRGSERLGEKQVEAALSHASTTRIEYQSNGGVVLWIAVRFEDLATDSPATTKARGSVALAVTAMPLELAPVIVAGGREIVVRPVHYRLGSPPADAINVRHDTKGRLVLPASAEPALDRLAGGPVVIYLQKVLP
jgi:hypothetical protein